MTDYKALAERVIAAFSPNAFSEEVQYRLDEATDVVAEVLRSALTPEWKPVPDPLPEGAAYGYYRIRRKDIHKFIQPPTCWNRTDVTVEREYWAAREELPHREFMLIAAFDEHDNPVVNGEVI